MIRNVAKETKAVLVDQFAFWETSKPDQEALKQWLADEKSHPNALGHRALARQLFTTLEIFDESSETCKLPLE